MKKILVLLAEGFETLEASVFIDVMGWNLLEGDQSTTLYTSGLRKEINSSFNQKFIVDYTIDQININTFDALAIPGGFEEYGYYKDAYSKEFTELILNFNKEKKIIASVCTGALPVGKSGVLKGLKGTTYNSEIRRNTLKELGVNVIDKSIVYEENIITSCSPSSAMNVAFLLLELLTNQENSHKVKKLMGFNS